MLTKFGAKSAQFTLIPDANVPINPIPITKQVTAKTLSHSVYDASNIIPGEPIRPTN